MSIIAPESVRRVLESHKRCDSWSLRLDKFSFPDDTRGSWKKPALDKSVEEFHRAFDSGRNVHQHTWLDRLAASRDSTFREIRLVNSSRLVVALGRSSVLENVGMATERATGIPLIPGSAVKGLVSTWAYWEGNVGANSTLESDKLIVTQRAQLPHDHDLLARRALGSDDSNDADAGDICFLGGFPVDPAKLRLEVDILNPHPTGGNPVPSFFLTIAAGALWRFPLLASHRAGADAAKLLETAERWLTESLTQAGIGAKTAAGYGRFRELTDPEKTKVEQERKSLESNLAEEQRKREQEECEKQEKAAKELAEATRRASLLPEDRAYEDFKKTIGDATAAGRLILDKPETEQKLILRFFRSEEGQRILKEWKNDKGLKRIENLKKAGL